MAFCDECGALFVRALAKWCSECGASRELEVEGAVQEVGGVNVRDNKLQGISEELAIPQESAILHLWNLQQLPNLTLYDRVYEQRVKGLPRDVTWGKSFLKQHYCYKKQHQKLLRNQEIVRSWFLPGKNSFVDDFLGSPSLRWNPDFLKKLRRYCRPVRSSGDIDERIVDIKFPEDGTKFYWRGSDIQRYALEIKHYRKSSKSILRGERLATEELREETLAIMPGPCEDKGISPEAAPLAPLNPNLEGNPRGGSTSRVPKPRRRRRPVKFMD